MPVSSQGGVVSLSGSGDVPHWSTGHLRDKGVPAGSRSAGTALTAGEGTVSDFRLRAVFTPYMVTGINT
jgi:hypothetical protein